MYEPNSLVTNYLHTIYTIILEETRFLSAMPSRNWNNKTSKHFNSKQTNIEYWMLWAEKNPRSNHSTYQKLIRIKSIFMLSTVDFRSTLISHRIFKFKHVFCYFFLPASGYQWLFLIQCWYDRFYVSIPMNNSTTHSDKQLTRRQQKKTWNFTRQKKNQLEY